MFQDWKKYLQGNMKLRMSHKDKIPQVDWELENITAEAAVQTFNVIETSENSTQTDSPFECGEFSGEMLMPKSYGWSIC